MGKAAYCEMCGAFGLPADMVQIDDLVIARHDTKYPPATPIDLCSLCCQRFKEWFRAGHHPPSFSATGIRSQGTP